MRDLQFAKDFVIHEMTHHRQRALLGGAYFGGSRGCHRDRGWYGAIAEAAPRYLGVAFPQSIWPKQKSVRINGKVAKIQEQGRLTEVEACHWPHSFRELIEAGDTRLKPAAL